MEGTKVGEVVGVNEFDASRVRVSKILFGKCEARIVLEGDIELKAERVCSRGSYDGAGLGEFLVVNVGKVLGHYRNILHVVRAVGKGPGLDEVTAIVMGK